MKASDATKTKLLGVATGLIGLCFFAFPIIEIYSEKMEISSKYGGGVALASQSPLYFWTKIVVEVIGALVAIIGGVLIFSNKIPLK